MSGASSTVREVIEALAQALHVVVEAVARSRPKRGSVHEHHLHHRGRIEYVHMYDVCIMGAAHTRHITSCYVARRLRGSSLLLADRLHRSNTYK